MRNNGGHIQAGYPARIAVLVLCLGALLGGMAQQFPAGMLLKNFSFPENYPPPHETQIKSLVHGAEAQPQKDGQILIKMLKLETFREDGKGEFIMEAVDCLYDANQHTAHSSGPLEMKTADGRFSTVGEGFLWRERESMLTISNRVHTVIYLDSETATTP